jgi:hypothetical protein
MSFIPWAKTMIRGALLWCVVGSTAGCHYYEEFREKKGSADIKEETAEMMRAYRLCVQKYEAEPAKVRELCGPYGQMLRDHDTKRQPVR